MALEGGDGSRRAKRRCTWCNLASPHRLPVEWTAGHLVGQRAHSLLYGVVRNSSRPAACSHELPPTHCSGSPRHVGGGRPSGGRRSGAHTRRAGRRDSRRGARQRHRPAGIRRGGHGPRRCRADAGPHDHRLARTVPALPPGGHPAGARGATRIPADDRATAAGARRPAHPRPGPRHAATHPRGGRGERGAGLPGARRSRRGLCAARPGPRRTPRDRGRTRATAGPPAGRALRTLSRSRRHRDRASGGAHGLGDQRAHVLQRRPERHRFRRSRIPGRRARTLHVLRTGRRRAPRRTLPARLLLHARRVRQHAPRAGWPAVHPGQPARWAHRHRRHAVDRHHRPLAPGDRVPVYRGRSPRRGVQCRGPNRVPDAHQRGAVHRPVVAAPGGRARHDGHGRGTLVADLRGA